MPVGPAARTITIISSSIGDYVWNDTNANGIQDEGELPLAEFPVTLTGTDLDGNTVSLTTTTDAAGQVPVRWSGFRHLHGDVRPCRSPGRAVVHGQGRRRRPGGRFRR
ncbi:SdrD B-like domain-containing protein [Variovorax sp. PBS-H4]|uniref:SdrD B-like domain-containing protein n=1 Tax=Variovorax sp. PBS-H4 TaxID=434008 RepID=UPI003FCE3C58